LKFYTNVEVYGNNVLVRENVDGVRSLRKDQWKPSVYLKDPTGKGEYKTLHGESVTKVNPGSIRDTRDFIKQYDGAVGFDIYGQLNYALQYMGDYQVTGWNYKSIKCFSIDIETALPPEGGFPHPEEAKGEILLITIQDVHTKKCYTFGSRPLAPQKYTNYMYCTSEVNLLKMFLQFWEQHTPDIITGWHVDGFDVPYLINRITQVLGADKVKKLSPWGYVDFEVENYKGTRQIKYKIAGIAVLDLMLLMKKYTFDPRESWGLGAVAQDVLGRTKLVNPGTTFQDFYTNHWETFVEYNVIDSVLVTELDAKMRLIELALTIAYKAHVNYEDVYSPVKTWDAILCNAQLKDNIVLPQRKSAGGDHGTIEGAYVKEPVPGVYKDVSSVDATALYPSLMLTLNISPETYIGQLSSNVDICLSGFYANDDKDVCMGANGATYTKKFLGMVPMVVAGMMEERKNIKNEMLQMESFYEGLKKSGDGDSVEASVTTSKISALDNSQMALKILLNSLYGGMANKGFRFYHPDIAESITMTGQLYLRSIERELDYMIATTFKVPESKFLIYADTDSAYITMETVIDKYLGKNASVESRIKALERLTVDHLQKMVNIIANKVSDGLNVYDRKIFFKQEIAADKVIFVGKKRYVCRVYSSEGVTYSKPKFKVKGLELVRSSTPKVIQKYLKDSLETIFDGTEATTQKYISDVRNDFMEMTPEQIAFPRGANNLGNYSDPTTIFKSGTPIQVRAVLLYNDLIKKRGLQDKYQGIEEGTKIKFIYLKVPNTIQQNTIAWPVDSVLPVELGLHKYVDYDLQFQKTFCDAIDGIISPLGWSVEERSSLEEFFG